MVVLLIADFLWQVTKAAINRRLAETDVPAEPGTELAVHQARLRTLLPIFRNIFMVVIAVLAGLMALSALGVEIGPLIAGAGVLGVAVGFGAQTVVKDIISGIFFSSTMRSASASTSRAAATRERSSPSRFDPSN